MWPSTIDDEPSLESAPPISWAKSINSQRLIFSMRRVDTGGIPSATTREGPLLSWGGSGTLLTGGSGAPRAPSNGSTGRSGPALRPPDRNN